MATQQENISLGYGIRRTPSIGDGGELSECANLIPHGGELVNIQPPVQLDIALPTNYKLLFIHETTSFRHYILQQLLVDSSTGKKSVATSTSSLQPVPTALFKFTLIITNKENTIGYEIKDVSASGVLRPTSWTLSIGLTLTSGIVSKQTISVSASGGTYPVTGTLDDVEGYNFSTNKVEKVTVYADDCSGRVLCAGASVADSSGGGGKKQSTDITESFFIFKADVDEITSMGNTIIVTDSTGLGYYLWKEDDNEYVFLGSDIPGLPMQFALKGSFKISGGSTYLTSTDDKLSLDDESTILNTFTGVLPSGKNSSLDFKADSGYIFESGKSYRIYNSSIYGVSVTFYSGIYTWPGFNIKPRKYKDFTAPRNLDKITVGHRSGGQSFTVSLDVYELESSSFYRFENSVANANAVLGEANKFIHSAMENSQFVMPFYVRAAIRLFDGSFKHQTIPCLMIPNSGNVPVIYTTTPSGKGQNCVLHSAASVCDLQYKLPASFKTEMNNWKDIITGVSISVSQPIYTYNPDKEFKETEEYITYNVLSTKSDSGSQSYYQGRISLAGQRSCGMIEYGSTPAQYYQVNYLYTMLESSDAIAGNFLRLVLPEHTAAEITDSFTKTSNFYIVKEYDTADLTCDDEFQTIDLEGKDLYSIPTYQTLPDDGKSHDVLSPEKMFVYNGRLNITNIKETIWGGDSPSLANGYCIFGDLIYNNKPVDVEYKAIVDLVINGEFYKVSSDWTYSNQALYWFFFPNRYAKRARIYRRYTLGEDTYTDKASIELTEHDLLEGAYWFNSLYPLEFASIDSESEDPDTDYTATKVYKNSVFTSNVGNPFVFPLANHNTIGAGEILGLSTATKALSQGQFGQFPLYAFCSDGIWALTVADDGTYSTKQPISRDVVSNADTITQIDDAVVFVTSQGLKIISGSEVKLLSEKIDGYNLSESFFEDGIPDDLYIEDTSQFTEFVQDAKIIYDYTHGMLHFFNDESYMHYVLDVASGEFSKQVLDQYLISSVQGYPYSTLQFADPDGKGNALTRYEKLFTDTKRRGFALTRSYAFGNPLSHKVLYDLRTIGQRVSTGTKFKIAVYISNDNVNWYRLTSLKMKSAKYYRFLVTTDMTDIETLSGISLQYQERYNHKMR